MGAAETLVGAPGKIEIPVQNASLPNLGLLAALLWMGAALLGTFLVGKHTMVNRAEDKQKIRM
jgi:hypothetical protein